MHRSRVGVVLIDHPASSAGAALSFWAGATGAEPVQSTGMPEYSSLGRAGGLNFEVQTLADQTPARVHLDIETDDVEAEVARLEDLGGIVSDRRDGWTIMHDPGGLVFCVVPVQTGEVFEAEAVTWS